MLIENVVIDFEDNAEEIKKWVALKGETKYLRFAELLKEKGVPVKWVILKDTYRYDKRLLVNCFKYLSFLEEFLRAQLWNFTQTSYENIETDFLFNIMTAVIENGDKIKYEGFSVDFLKDNKEKVNYLRRRVAHNKIMLEGDSVYELCELLSALKVVLPDSYINGFVSDINKCVVGLNIPSELKLKLT